MVGYVILGLLAVFFAVILVRAMLFRPKKQPFVQPEAVSFDGDKAVDALAQLIRCKTISYSDPSLEDEMRVTVIATGFNGGVGNAEKPAEKVAAPKFSTTPAEAPISNKQAAAAAASDDDDEYGDIFRILNGKK